jgi:hypothetical protein
MEELPIIQRAYDLIKWYVPILNRLPRVHKFLLGERIISGLYDLLEGLIMARYAGQKVEILERLNARLDLLRHQTRLLHEFNELSVQRYEHVSSLLNEVGSELGGWLRQQRQKK